MSRPMVTASPRRGTLRSGQVAGSDQRRGPDRRAAAPPRRPSACSCAWWSWAAAPAPVPSSSETGRSKATRSRHAGMRMTVIPSIGTVESLFLLPEGLQRIGRFAGVSVGRVARSTL